MMSTLELYNALKTIIDLPEDCTQLSIHLRMDSIPTLEATTYVKGPRIAGYAAHTVATEHKEFFIVPKGDVVEANLQELVERVIAYDWSDNDEDAVKTINDLRTYMEATEALRKLP